MVVANTSRGLTQAFDLSKPADLSSLQELLASGRVTALALLRDGVQHVLPSPRGFRRPVFGAEPVINGAGVVGERIFVQAGDTRLTLSTTFTSAVVRTDLVRTGVMRYNPQDKQRTG